MPCSNHPDVTSGLDRCTRCGRDFCIDCLVGRKAGWFCGPCDAAVAGAGAAARPVEALPAAGPAPAPAPSLLPPRRACANHPEVLDRLNPCSRCRKNFCPDCLVELKSGRFCAGCKTEAIKDLQSGVDQTQLPLAHLGRRFVAFIIDSIVIIFGMGALGIPLFLILLATHHEAAASPEGLVGLGLQLLFQAAGWVLILAYRAVLVQKWGQTIGKMAMGIKVVSPDGSAVTTGQAWMRAFIESLVALCCYGICYVFAFFNKEKCGLHDMSAKTRVVRVS